MLRLHSKNCLLNLLKFSLAELQTLACKENIKITKTSKLTGKEIKLKKEEIAQALLKLLLN